MSESGSYSKEEIFLKQEYDENLALIGELVEALEGALAECNINTFGYKNAQRLIAKARARMGDKEQGK